MGVSRQTASKWLRRSRSGEGLADRSSRPRRLARLHAARGRGAGGRRQAEAHARPARPRRRDGRARPHLRQDRGEARDAQARRRRPGHGRGSGGAGPATPVRYERERPGELVHVDVKKVARIPGRRRAPRAGARLRLAPAALGRSCLHVAIDDHSRVAYAELLPDERKGTCAAFMGRAPALLRGAGPDGRTRDDRQRPGLPQRRVQRAARGRRRPARLHEALQPVAERQGGADEPHHRTGVAERKGMESEAGRADALPAFIERYNWERPHSACGGLPPMSRIVGVNNLSAHNS